MTLQEKTYLLIFSTIIVFLIIFTPISVQISFSQNEDLNLQQEQSNSNSTSGNNKDKFTVNDSETILLVGKNLPSGDYLHLYDSSPYKISNTHITAKIPCNDEFTTDIVFLFGPDTKIPISGLDLIPELSKAGELCSYQGNIVTNETSSNITDIAIFNNSPDNIEFPDSSSLVIKVSEIMTPDQ